MKRSFAAANFHEYQTGNWVHSYELVLDQLEKRWIYAVNIQMQGFSTLTWNYTPSLRDFHRSFVAKTKSQGSYGFYSLYLPLLPQPKQTDTNLSQRDNDIWTKYFEYQSLNITLLAAY